jgi:RNA polymerase sigma-70 factor (ECF subfamily)
MGLDRQTREACFTRLFEANYSAVRAYAWRRRPDTADDVVSETFAIAWQRLERVPDTPLPWLIGVARNVHRNMERAELRRRQREMRSASTEYGDCVTESVETDGSLAEALTRLREGDREILLLAAWERLDRAGLAAALGCSKTAAGVRLHRARKRLEAALSVVETEDLIGSAQGGGVLNGS